MKLKVDNETETVIHRILSSREKRGKYSGGQSETHLRRKKKGSKTLTQGLEYKVSRNRPRDLERRTNMSCSQKGPRFNGWTKRK